MTTERAPDNRPAYMIHRWAGCTKCGRRKRYRVFGTRLEQHRSPCCGAPVRCASWAGWTLRDPAKRLLLATYPGLGRGGVSTKGGGTIADPERS